MNNRARCYKCCSEGNAFFKYGSEYDEATDSFKRYRECRNCKTRYEVKRRNTKRKREREELLKSLELGEF